MISMAHADVSPVELIGRVFATDTGRPVPGIYVDLSNGCALGTSCATVTDSNGTFGLEALPGATTIYASSNNSPLLNYLPTSVDFEVEAGDTNNVVIYMQPGASISGIVTRTADAGAIPNAAVALYAMTENGTYQFSGATTDASGRYSIRQIPPGQYQISVQTDAYLPQFFAGHAWTPPSQGTQVSDPITLAGAQSIDNIDFSLSPSGRLRGTITDKWTGLPIAGSNDITFFMRDGNAQDSFWFVTFVPTDAMGHYNVGGLPTSPLVIEVDDYSHPSTARKLWVAPRNRARICRRRPA